MGGLEGSVEFLVIFEDDDLLAVNKPAGLSTHAPGPYSGEGLYEWLRHREPRWASLAIIHRLDKETSGVIVFAKTPQANRSLTEQFASRAVKKKYFFLTDRAVEGKELTVKSCLVRAGEKYVSRPLHVGAQIAETRFRLVASRGNLRAPTSNIHPAYGGIGRYSLVEAEPLTGRTHQIRVHAAENGFPVLGDILYGGTPARRVCLHAVEIALKHPVTGKSVTFSAPAEFGADARLTLRAALIEPKTTSAYRLVHGASDAWPGWFVDRLGDFLLSQSERPLTEPQLEELRRLLKILSVGSAYHKLLTRIVRQTARSEACPQPVFGEAAPDCFTIVENSVRYELSFDEGYSVGLFLDQRDNRRRLMTGHVAAGFGLLFPPRPRNPDLIFPSRFEDETEEEEEEDIDRLEACPTVLNTFAYTCGFSVCAAKAGARTTSLDLSRKYLEWGKRNFQLNGINPADHDFIYGDVFDWLRRLARKNRCFDVVLLDPPTFSQSKVSGVFRAEKDYSKLVAAALPLLKSSGVLFASSNAEDWPPEHFVAMVEGAIRSGKRTILQRHYVPQPPDFPVSRAQPAYLKTLWLRVA